MASVLVAFAPTFVSAETVTIGSYNPYDNDNQVGSTVVGGGSSVTIVGDAQFERGVTGTEPIKLSQMLSEGRIISGAEYATPNNPLTDHITLARTNVRYFDAATNSYKTLSVNDSSLFKVSKLGDPNVSALANAKGGQYIDLRVGTVDASGGHLDVRIGDASQESTSSANSITIVPKSTSLFLADGTGDAQSVVEWNAGNMRVNYQGSVPPNSESADGTLELNFRPDYKGAFTAFDGTQWEVNDYDQMVAYSDWLKQKASEGAIRSQTEYDAAFAQGMQLTSRKITYSNDISPSDETLLPLGKVAILHAQGANATAIVGRDARIDALNVGTYGDQKGGVLLAEQGGTVINEGRISLGSSSGARVSTGIQVLDGSGINNGLINVNFLAADHDPDADEIAAMNTWAAYGAVAEGVNATFENNGILNIAGNSGASSGASVYGIGVRNGASATNTGTINVGVSPNKSQGTLSGVVATNGSFTNDGEIYVGRGPQYELDSPEVVADVEAGKSASGAATYAILTSGMNGSVVNRNSITLGSKMGNAVAISASSKASAVNEGQIRILGDLGAYQLQNVGMLAYGATDVRNNGRIDLLGANAVGLKADASSGLASTVINTGTINVSGSIDPNGLRNIGVEAQGNKALALISDGLITLTGDGAIGAYAHDGGNVSMGGGAIDFVNGEQQIGFFAHGIGSSVNITSAPEAGLVVGTANSTLFRIEDGATINNAAGAKLIASGKDSTAVQVTGVGSTANLDGMDITVSGDGATAVKVEGGATGQMSGAAKLALKDGTTAVVVDNLKYDLSGQAVASAQSTFTNSADLKVLDAKDVTAFSVRNGGKLINAGDIELSHGTAIEIAGIGSSMVADANGQRGKITVHHGIAGIHVHAGATLNTMDDITVDGSASGVLVGADAGRVVIEKDAKITGISSALGNLITNLAVAGNTLVDGATLEMAGKGAALLTENNLHQDSHGHVISSGEGTGIAVMKSDRSMLDRIVAFGKEWLVDVTGKGSGFSTNNAGTTVIGSQVNVSGSGTAVASAHEKGVLVLSEEARLTASNAEATLVSGKADTVVNRGVLQAASADATAVSLEGAGTFANLGDGRITGAVNMGDGDSTVLLADASQLDGVLFTGEGDNLVEVQGADVRFGQLLGGTSGLDTLVFNAHDYQATAQNTDQIQNFERVELINGTTLTLERDFQLSSGASAAKRSASLDTNNLAGWLAIDASSTLAALQDGHSVLGSVANAGRVTLDNGIAGTALTVSGDFVGANGVVELDTVLGDDNSVTDKLVVEGNTSGTTFLKVNNAGGKGAYTTADGIEVVEVGGASDGTFTLASRVVAGTNEYLLEQGGKSYAADGNWYLRSELPVVEPPVEPEEPTDPETPVEPKDPNEPEAPVDPKNPIDPETPVDPKAPSNPEEPIKPIEPPQGKPSAPIYRPEVGAYLGNQMAATNMFQHTLHERVGELDFSERQRGEDGKASSLWMRGKRSEFTADTGSKQIDLATTTDLMQIGGDIARWGEGDNRFHVGVMAGEGKSRSQVKSDVTQYGAKGEVDGYSVGVYGTWYQTGKEGTGPYIDTWLQHGRYKNTVKGDGLTKESYDSRTWSASLEAGYAVEVGRDDVSAYFVEPQAQVIYSEYDADKHVEHNGTVVESKEAGGVTTRLGARAYIRPLNESGTRVQPFVEANWWHNEGDNAMAFNDSTLKLNRAKDVFEAKLGAEVDVGNGWSTWGHLSSQSAAGDERTLGGQLGVKFSW
jgi:outer membrane autotransporter protein